MAEIQRMIDEVDAETVKLLKLIGVGREIRADLVKHLARVRDGDGCDRASPGARPAAEIIRIKP